MNKLLNPTSLISDMPDSPIIDVLRLASQRKDIVPLWLGESSFPTDPLIMDAAIDAMQAGRTFYTPNRGIPELRDAIARYYRRIYGAVIPDTRISVTNSGMHAVTMIATALMEPGDNAVLMTPCWPNIDRTIRVIGGEVREAELTLTDGQWALDLQRVFDLCDARTRLIYFASPSNPTGWTIDEEDAARLLAFARDNAIAVISDEVYQRLSFVSDYGSTMLSMAQPDDPLIVVNSFSKAWAMTGWRLGWMIFPERFLDAFEKLSQFSISGSPAFVQMAGVAALDHGEAIVHRIRKHCETAKSLVEARLAQIPGIEVLPGSGGYYTMFRSPETADCMAFCRTAALSAGVGLAPGAAFGLGGRGRIRLCHARSLETLDLALDRLDHHFVASCV